MARREIVVVTDDLDGAEGARPVTFAFDGTQYEIDLTEENVDALHQALTPYIVAARKKGGGGRRSSSRHSSTGSSSAGGKGSAGVASIRAWARENGIEVSERGRIPQSVRDKYEAAQ